MVPWVPRAWDGVRKGQLTLQVHTREQGKRLQPSSAPAHGNSPHWHSINGHLATHSHFVYLFSHEIAMALLQPELKSQRPQLKSKAACCPCEKAAAPSHNRQVFWQNTLNITEFTIISWKLKLKYPGTGRSVLAEVLLGDQHKALCLEDCHLGSSFIRDGFHLRSCQFINPTSALGYTGSHIGGGNFSHFFARGP